MPRRWAGRGRLTLGARSVCRTLIRIVIARPLAVRSIAFGSVTLAVIAVVDRAAVAAGFAPAVAVGGVTVVQERLGPLDEGRDAELVQGARVTVGFTRAGPHVGGGPDGVELLTGHPGEQVAHPVAVVAADEFHVPLRLLAPLGDTVRVDLGDGAADRVGVPRRGAASGLGQHHVFHPPGQVEGQRCGQLGELGRLVPGQVTGTDRAQRRRQPGVQRDAHVDQVGRGA